MSFSDLIARLEEALSHPLPGAEAQALMAPRPRRGWPPGMDPAGFRQAAGLLLVFPVAGDASIVLTVRAHTLDRHGGQVSLPGGVIEPDETYSQAALREAHEEIGLSLGAVRTLGTLTWLDIPVSGFRLHPVVAAINERPQLAASHREVARILEVQVKNLMDPQRTAWRTMMREGRAIDFPAFVTNDVEIWGATAMVLAEFLTILGWDGPAQRL